MLYIYTIGEQFESKGKIYIGWDVKGDIQVVQMNLFNFFTVNEKNHTMMINLKKHRYISLRLKIEKAEAFLKLF